MSRTARKLEIFAPARPVEENSVRQAAARVATPDDMAFDSPALRLQAHLETLVEPRVQGRWSYRRTFMFLAAVNGAFWISLFWVVSRFW